MTYQDIFPNELGAKKRTGAHLIDVREQDESAAGHIPRAVNLPLSELSGGEDEVPSPTVLICASGNRSWHAAADLAALGQTGLMNLTGGTVSWMREGRELNRSQQP